MSTLTWVTNTNYLLNILNKMTDNFCACVFVVLSLLATATTHAAEPDWDLYDRVLEKHVTRGTKDGVDLNLVDYSALASDEDFSRVVASVAEFNITELATREEELAFYINAYNILALKVVSDNWPVESIKEIGNFFKPVWKQHAGKLNGRDVSLDEVEHKILRKMGEPRIHFAIVCASVSCPDLRTEAFRAIELDAQLNQQSETFLNNTAKGLRVDGTRAEVSKIFKWFKEDFETLGGVAAFISRYTELPRDASVRPAIDYNWSVNALKRAN